MEIVKEFLWQFITFAFMAGVIVLAVFLGHKARDLFDRIKEKKAAKEAASETNADDRAE